MKKTYINPEITVVEFHTQMMLAASLEVVSDVEVKGSAALGREYDFDDEEE